MKCNSCCKYFNQRAVSGKCLNNIYGEIDHVTFLGRCSKYNISTDTDKDCLDTLPYNKK